MFDIFSLNSSTHHPCKLIQYHTRMHFSNEEGVHKAWHSQLCISSAKWRCRGLQKRHGFCVCVEKQYTGLYIAFSLETLHEHLLIRSSQTCMDFSIFRSSVSWILLWNNGKNQSKLLGIENQSIDSHYSKWWTVKFSVLSFPSLI